MPFKEFVYFEINGLGSGLTWEGSYSPFEDRIIKRIYLQRKDGASWTASTVYFKIGEYVFTKPVAPASVFGPTKLTSPDLDIPIKAKDTLQWTFKNNEGAAIDVMLTLELWTP